MAEDSLNSEKGVKISIKPDFARDKVRKNSTPPSVKKTPLNLKPHQARLSTPRDRLTASSSSDLYCRICHEDDAAEDLIAPCYCSGTMGLIHRSCMQKWLNATNTTSCELCKCKIQLRTRRKGTWEWISWQLDEWAIERDRHRRPNELDTDGRHLLGDAICFFFLTPMALTSAALCADSAVSKSNEPWQAAGLILLTVFLTSIYCIWMAMAIRFHQMQFRAWQEAHLELFIAATPYPPQRQPGSRLRGVFKSQKLRVLRDGSYCNGEGVRPLPSAGASLKLDSCLGSTSVGSDIAISPLNESVFAAVAVADPGDDNNNNNDNSATPKTDVSIDVDAAAEKASGDAAVAAANAVAAADDVLTKFGVVMEDSATAAAAVAATAATPKHLVKGRFIVCSSDASVAATTPRRDLQSRAVSTPRDGKMARELWASPGEDAISRCVTPIPGVAFQRDAVKLERRREAAAGKTPLHRKLSIVQSDL